MNKQVYSNEEFHDIKNRINNEIKRRGTYKWWDPLTKPTVGIDQTSPTVIPTNEGIEVNEKTYTVNNPSEGSIEETRNIQYPAHGDNPGGVKPSRNYIGPNTSAASLNSDELRNLIVGLSKIEDINLFYGRDEVSLTAFRDPEGLEKVIERAEKSELNALIHESDISLTKIDPNGGIPDRYNLNYPVNDHLITYPKDSNDHYYMPSGESDGEELLKHEGLGINNFYDDYGANPGDSDFHPYNRYTSPLVNRDWNDQDNQRNPKITKVRPGGLKSERFGKNPRNPNEGDPYPSRPVYGGKEGSCIGACTGMCFMTCDNECGESCSSTCWSRCGEACTAQCGNSCTSCTSSCFNTCRTKCENNTGYSCVKAGAKTVKIWTTGGKKGIPAENHISFTTHTCDGCSFSCQFYPNKKTECWDAGCMGKCFTSCNTACSDSCHGGCINNHESNDDRGYQTGKGRGCMDGCTINCVGGCSGVCIGYCISTCWHTCKSTCSDNCFKAGTLIETIDGPVPIEQLKVGDKVLTQSGEYHSITHVHCRKATSDETFQIIATGSLPIYTTKNHPFWVKKYAGTGTTKKTQYQQYNDPTWINAEDISYRDRLCLLTFKPGNISINPGIAYMVGRWLGDGWRFDEISKYTGQISSRFGIYCGYHEEDDFDMKIKQCKVKFTKYKQDTIIRYDILRRDNPELISLLKKCGKGARNKFIPREFFDWDELSLTYLLQGYIDSDGCIDKKDTIHLTSISKKLSYGIVNILRCLGKNPSWSTRIYDNSKDHYIEGRKVSISNSYVVQTSYFKSASNVSSKYDDLDGHVWGTIKTHKPLDIEYNVYNITVEGDPTYYADGILVHNCSYECHTDCGAGCAEGCKDGCKGCVGECASACGTSAESRTCVGCGAEGGCTSQCQFDCNTNCMGFGCRSICGIGDAGSCSANCRINCTATSCTAMCSEACSEKCSTCVNTCGHGCGACTSNCSTGCGARCNINCSADCKNDCSENCTQSCTEECGGCSNLCYSCIGKCIGICSVKCENGCSSCSNLCGYWCDSSCNQKCFSNCDSFCISNCSGSCSTLLQSDTTLTEGPERPPTSQGYIYPNPKNRWEERESFKLTRDILPYVKPPKEVKEYLITIQFDENKNFEILRPEGIEIDIRATTETGGVFQIDSETGEITIDEEMLNASISKPNPSLDGEESVFFVILKYNDLIPYTDDDITAILPFGFMTIIPYCHTKDKDTIVIITKVSPEYFPGEDDYEEWHEDFHDKYQ